MFTNGQVILWYAVMLAERLVLMCNVSLYFIVVICLHIVKQNTTF